MDNLDKIKKEIEKLKEEIRQADFSYYVLSDPEISDKEYDDLVARLRQLEKEYPQFITFDSPTQRVSGGVREGFASIRHQVKMFSLDNTYTIEELRDWEKKIKRMLKSDEELDYTAELKIDGVSCSLIYEKGIFTLGATRGDGDIGEDITQNLKAVKSIPLKLIGRDIPDILEVRGEIYMDKNVFEKINSERAAEGLPAFANPRNSASGSLKLLDSGLVSARNLKCFVHSFGKVEGYKFDKHNFFLEKIKNWGLRVNAENKYCKDLNEVINYCHLWQSRRESLEFEADGVVVKVNPFSLQGKLGATSKSPRWAVAYKFPAHQATTVVEDIIFGIGRTGILTPVARLKPVECGGVVISRSTLHNFDEIKRLDVRVGDTVLIERAGDVIPKIVKVIISKRKGFQRKIRVPKHCPVCKEIIGKENEKQVYWYCVNPNCPARIKQSLLHFASRAAMDIEGMGNSVVEELVDRKLVKNLADIYKIKKEDFLSLPFFAEKKTDNLINAINVSKKKSLACFLYGLGIKHVGEKGASILAGRFKNIERFFSLKEEDLKNIPEVGEVTAFSITQFFAVSHVQEMIRQFKEAGFSLVEEDKHFEVSEITGKVFLFTGKLLNFSREQARKLIEKSGAKWTESVSENVDFVVAGNDPGDKYRKAEKIGLKILKEHEFEALIRKK